MLAATAALLLPAAADASGTVKVSIANFKIKPATSSTSAGKTTFVVKNSDAMVHELVVIKTNRRADALPVHNGRASERGRKGRVEVDGNDSARLTLTLSRGHYVLICNISGHYAAGMRTDFTVR
jgi:uncharacterized cupredoxin-like copper-binding protein